MPPYETARRELHLSDTRDRERDRDVDLLLTVFSYANPQDPSTRAWRPWRTRRRRRLARRAWRALVDIAESTEEAVGLFDVDLALSEQLKDLLALFTWHLVSPACFVELVCRLVDRDLPAREALKEIPNPGRSRRCHRDGPFGVRFH